MPVFKLDAATNDHLGLPQDRIFSFHACNCLSIFSLSLVFGSSFYTAQCVNLRCPQTYLLVKLRIFLHKMHSFFVCTAFNLLIELSVLGLFG